MKVYSVSVVFDPQVPVHEAACPQAGFTVFASVWWAGQVAGLQASVLAFGNSFFEPSAFTNRTTTHAIIRMLPIIISSFFISDSFLIETSIIQNFCHFTFI
jgi:hypothetical protein